MKTVNYLLIIAFLLLFASCTTTKVVTVEKVKIDTTYITKWQRDSVWLHDSTIVREKGDMVLVEKWHTKYKEKQVHDTLYKSRVDSIPVPYPVEKLVEKELTWWQQTRLHLANIILCLLGVVAVWWIGGLIRKKFMP
jgi:hypothetical protein